MSEGGTASRRLRVLFINENIGGHATVHHHLRRALLRVDDIEARFVDLPPATGVRRLVSARIPGLARLDLDLQPLRAQLAQSAWLARRLGPLVAEADAVHLYTHNAGLLSAGHWRRVPTVVSLDSTNAQNAYRLPTRHPTAFTPLTVRATKVFERRVYGAASLVMANSAWAAASLRRDYRVGDEALRIQPLGILGPDFGPGPAPGTAAGRGRPRLVFVGRSLDRKGGRLLLEVYRQRFQAEAELVLVTGDRVDPSPGVTVISDIRPGDPRLWDLLRQSAAFVFPSEIDMAPNAVIEAMMAGLPIVARPVGAIPEMVADGTNGLLVEPGARALTEALEEVVASPDLRETMGAASRRRAVDVYDARTTTAGLIEVLTEAVDRHRSAGSSPPWQRGAMR